MRIVVIGGTGLIGSKVVARLAGQGHKAIAASPSSGVNAVTGEGSPRHWPARRSSSTSLTHLRSRTRRCSTSSRPRPATSSQPRRRLAWAIMLRCPSSARNVCRTVYSRAKLVQEKLIKESGISYSIVHATQFFEFVKRIADSATEGNTVRLSHALIQPIAADAVAGAVARTAVGEPSNGTIEIAGPEQFGLDELIRKGLSSRGDPREVVADPEARYFGALLQEHTLVPGADALILGPRFEDWLVPTTPQN